MQDEDQPMKLEDVDPRWKKRFTDEELIKLLKKMERKRSNAKRRSLSFTLGINDWLMLGEKLLVKGKQYCDYTGLPLSNKTTEFGGDNPWFPTVERIDDKVGYCSGNLCVCCERANALKDSLCDKGVPSHLISKDDRKVVQALMRNFSEARMEELKQAYVFSEEKAFGKAMPCKEKAIPVAVKDDDAPEAEEKPSAKLVDSIKQAKTIEEYREVQNKSIDAMNKASEEGSTTTVPSVEPSPATITASVVLEEKAKVFCALPEDVNIAEVYAGYARAFANLGVNVSITYAQFKAKYARKYCALTGEPLPEGRKPVLLVDHDKGFSAQNMLIVHPRIEAAVTKLMVDLHMDLRQIAQMFKPLAK